MTAPDLYAGHAPKGNGFTWCGICADSVCLTNRPDCPECKEAIADPGASTGSARGLVEDGGQAFPCSATESDTGQDGMTLRDYFAAKALAAILTECVSRFDPNAAPNAYRYADAMIHARKGGS